MKAFVLVLSTLSTCKHKCFNLSCASCPMSEPHPVIVSYIIVSYHIALYHIILSYCIISYCIISYHIVSYRIHNVDMGNTFSSPCKTTPHRNDPWPHPKATAVTSHSHTPIQPPTLPTPIFPTGDDIGSDTFQHNHHRPFYFE